LILPNTLKNIRILNRLPFPKLSSSSCSIAKRNKMALTDEALDSSFLSFLSDMRDLGQILAHVHDAEIEVSEGPKPPAQ
jgi:hypothetical protein